MIAQKLTTFRKDKLSPVASILSNQAKQQNGDHIVFLDTKTTSPIGCVYSITGGDLIKYTQSL